MTAVTTNAVRKRNCMPTILPEDTLPGYLSGLQAGFLPQSSRIAVMDRRPFQISLRSILWATLWMGICCLMLRLVTSRVVPVAAFPLAVVCLCAAVRALFANSRTTGAPVGVMPFAISIAAWHLIALVMYYVYGWVLVGFVTAAWTAWFGDIQASSGWYWRASSYAFIATTTFAATVASVRLFDALSGQPWRCKLAAITILGWEALVIPVLIVSYEIGFAWMITEFRFDAFGPPKETYTFGNLILPHLLAWLILTTPVAWVSLWVHSHGRVLGD